MYIFFKQIKIYDNKYFFIRVRLKESLCSAYLVHWIHYNRAPVGSDPVLSGPYIWSHKDTGSLLHQGSNGCLGWSSCSMTHCLPIKQIQKKITSSYQKWQCLQKRKMPNKKEKQRLMCEYNSSLCLIATGVTRNSLIGLMKINAFKLSAQTFIQIVY